MPEAKRIILETEKVKNPYSGLGQFCLHLGHELLAENFSDLYFYLPADKKSLFSQCKNFIEQKAHHKIFGIPTTENDIVHITHQTSSYLPSNKKAKVILTVHDLNFLYKYKGLKLNRKKKELQKKINRADSITAISHFAANELKDHMDLQGKSVHVIHNGNSLDTSITPIQPKWFGQKPFLFTIGIISERKNFHVLIEMMEQLPEMSLIIAGDHSSEYAKNMMAIIAQKKLQHRVLLPGKISDNEKLWLYQNCEGLVFPSLAEGFGFPLVEAMSQGKPVFVNKATSLPEIAGKHGFYWTNFDPAAMAEVVKKGLHYVQEHQPQNDYRAHAAQFDWRNAAHRYADIYCEFLKK